VRIRKERQDDLAILITLIFEDECVWNRLEHLGGLIIVIFCALVTLGPFSRVLYQLLHARFVGSTLLRRQRLSIYEECPGKLPIFGIDDITVLRAFVILPMDAVAPVRVVGGICFQLVLNRLPDVLGGILRKWRKSVSRGCLNLREP
jgi:hypothetical protein